MLVRAPGVSPGDWCVRWRDQGGTGCTWNPRDWSTVHGVRAAHACSSLPTYGKGSILGYERLKSFARGKKDVCRTTRVGTCAVPFTEQGNWCNSDQPRLDLGGSSQHPNLVAETDCATSSTLHVAPGQRSKIANQKQLQKHRQLQDQDIPHLHPVGSLLSVARRCGQLLPASIRRFLRC